MTKNIFLGLALILGALGSLLGYSALSHQPVEHTALFGSTGTPTETYTNPAWWAGGIAVGPTGTFNTNTQFGTCNLIGTSVSLAATSTGNYDCAVTGIKSGDTVFPDAPAGFTAGVVVGNIFPIAAHASTTAGFITFTLLNLSGAASSSLDANVASGTEYTTER